MSLDPKQKTQYEGAETRRKLPNILSEPASRNPESSFRIHGFHTRSTNDASRKSGSSLLINESHTHSTNDEDKKVSAVQKTLKPSSPETTAHHVVLSPNIQNTQDEVAGIRSELPNILSDPVSRNSVSSFLNNESHSCSTSS